MFVCADRPCGSPPILPGNDMETTGCNQVKEADVLKLPKPG